MSFWSKLCANVRGFVPQQILQRKSGWLNTLRIARKKLCPRQGNRTIHLGMQGCVGARRIVRGGCTLLLPQGHGGPIAQPSVQRSLQRSTQRDGRQHARDNRHQASTLILSCRGVMVGTFAARRSSPSYSRLAGGGVFPTSRWTLGSSFSAFLKASPMTLICTPPPVPQSRLAPHHR